MCAHHLARPLHSITELSCARGGIAQALPQSGRPIRQIGLLKDQRLG
jgi:hypothetical protein